MPPLHQSPSPSSSSASSLTSLKARRIRFAPLPDPTALHDDDDQHKPRPLPAAVPAAAAPPKPTAQQMLSHAPIPQPTFHKPKSLNLLRPFPFRRSLAAPSNASSNSLTPTPSNDSACPTPTRSSFSISKEEILTLGTINLFRTSSKSSDTSTAASSSGWRFNLSPLSRTQSAQHPPTPSMPIPGGGRRPASVDAKALHAPHSPLRKGTRMLNGRVYGGARRPQNPFASARDEDPEFVEWGHGGMGSVRGAVHAGIGIGSARTRWERLGEAVAAQEEDEYDGSGMGWVKKRKEARERAAREEKEKSAQQEVMTVQDTQTQTLEHNLATVTIPHLARHHSHRRPSSRGTSAEGVPSPAPDPPSPSETETESESESNPEREDEDEDEEEEDEEMQRRKTALGAEKEKFSRHQEN